MTPIWSSRLLTISLTADCARRSLRAAAEKLPSSAAAMKLRNWSRDTPSSTLGSPTYLQQRWIVPEYGGWSDGRQAVCNQVSAERRPYGSPLVCNQVSAERRPYGSP